MPLTQVATPDDDDDDEHEHEDPPERAMAGSHEDRMLAGGFTIVSKRRGRGPPTRPPREESLVTANGARANLVGNARAAPSGDSSAADDEILDQRLDAAVAELRAAAFAQHGRAMTASDMLRAIGPVFKGFSNCATGSRAGCM